MYSKLKKLLNFSEEITWYLAGEPKGEITAVYMDEWVEGVNRCTISGKTNDGKNFNLVLEVSECQKSE